MIKEPSVTPPVLGHILIGRPVDQNGQCLPAESDQFIVATPLQSATGWMRHPYDADLRHNLNGSKLRSIPVRLLFNEPQLSLRTGYGLFHDAKGRLWCVSPRLYVKIGDDDDLGTFIVPLHDPASVNTLMTRLRYYQAVSRNRLACLPLQLRLRDNDIPDLTVRDGLSLINAIKKARKIHRQRKACGFDQTALDAVVQSRIDQLPSDEERGSAGTASCNWLTSSSSR